MNNLGFVVELNSFVTPDIYDTPLTIIILQPSLHTYKYTKKSRIIPTKL